MEIKEKLYKFKPFVSDDEKAEVMKIIKYNKNGLVYESSLEEHPELKEYFIEENQTNLSAEAEGGKDE